MQMPSLNLYHMLHEFVNVFTHGPDTAKCNMSGKAAIIRPLRKTKVRGPYLTPRSS